MAIGIKRKVIAKLYAYSYMWCECEFESLIIGIIGTNLIIHGNSWLIDVKNFVIVIAKEGHITAYNG